MEPKKSLSVCIFTNLYPPAYSGSSMHCQQLAHELARRGCKVTVITSKIDNQSNDEEVNEGVSIFRLPSLRLPRLHVALNFPLLNTMLSPSNQRRISEILSQYQPDLIHLHNHMFDSAIYAVRMSQKFKIPLIITIHTMLRHPNRVYNLILTLVDRTILKKFVIEKADCLICPDKIIQNYINHTFRGAKTSLVPYGIHPLPDPSPEKMLAIRNKYRLGDGPIILSVGHLHDIRNRKELIEIMPQLMLHFPNLKVLVVGDIGTNYPEDYARKLGVQDNLLFVGPVAHSEIQEYLGIADIEATWFDRNHPDKSMGIAAREAMAAGLTVITAADLDAHGEGILIDGENIVHIDLFDLTSIVKQFIEIIENTSKRRGIGYQARKLVRKHFSWASVYEQTREVYFQEIKHKKLLQ